MKKYNKKVFVDFKLQYVIYIWCSFGFESWTIGKVECTGNEAAFILCRWKCKFGQANLSLEFATNAISNVSRPCYLIVYHCGLCQLDFLIYTKRSEQRLFFLLCFLFRFYNNTAPRAAFRYAPTRNSERENTKKLERKE